MCSVCAVTATSKTQNHKNTIIKSTRLWSVVVGAEMSLAEGNRGGCTAVTKRIEQELRFVGVEIRPQC